ncbi:hypothetical protein [Streptomyces sp. NPDC056192]
MCHSNTTPPPRRTACPQRLQWSGSRKSSLGLNARSLLGFLCQGCA